MGIARLGAETDTREAERRLAALAAVTGAPPESAHRAFMFTNITGSTVLLEAIGDEAWTDLRRWHDEELRRSFATLGGEEVDHTGDGFFVAFGHAAAAIGCAPDIQRRRAQPRRQHGFAPQVRIGVHAAHAKATGTTYTGMGVHVAARIGPRRRRRDRREQVHGRGARRRRGRGSQGGRAQERE